MPPGGGGGGGGVAAPGDMACRVCFVNELFINLGIQCNNVDAF